ncbi:MAG: hypothetical protein GY774_28010 [Planctomycetes bacterium]|nr:hypothetical protein [Planctomycetota bacterium]
MIFKIANLPPFLMLRYLALFVAFTCGIASFIQFFRIIGGDVTFFDVAAPVLVSTFLFVGLYVTRDKVCTNQPC